MGGQDQEAAPQPDRGTAEPRPTGGTAAPQPDRGTAEPRPTGGTAEPRQDGGLAARLTRPLRQPGRMRLAAIAGVIVAVGVALSVIGTTVGAGARPPRTLGHAKNFTLHVLGHPGQRLSLTSLAGRPVIVNFFASWCTPCQKETPLLARFYRGRHGRVTIIGVDANDSAAKAQAFVARKKVGYPVVVDPFPAKTAIAYGVPGLPATFFLNAKHSIVKRVYGAVTQAELASGAALMYQRDG